MFLVLTSIGCAVCHFKKMYSLRDGCFYVLCLNFLTFLAPFFTSPSEYLMFFLVSSLSSIILFVNIFLKKIDYSFVVVAIFNLIIAVYFLLKTPGGAMLRNFLEKT